MSSRTACREAKDELAESVRNAELAVLSSPPRRAPRALNNFEDALAAAWRHAFVEASPKRRASGTRVSSLPLALPIVFGLGIGAAATRHGDYALAVRTRAGRLGALWIDETTVRRLVRAKVDVDLDIRQVRATRPQVATGDRLGNCRSFATGSVGAVLPRTRRAVTANHVVALVNEAAVGDPVVDGDRQRIGTLDWYLPLVPGEPNRLDLATVELDQAPEEGVTRAPVDPEPGDEVLLRGARSGATRGLVSSVEHDESISYPGSKIPFVELIEVTGLDGPFSRPGDSGAIALSGSGVAGMVIAGVVADRRSLVTSAAPMFGTLEVATMIV